MLGPIPNARPLFDPSACPGASWTSEQRLAHAAGSTVVHTPLSVRAGRQTRSKSAARSSCSRRPTRHPARHCVAINLRTASGAASERNAIPSNSQGVQHAPCTRAEACSRRFWRTSGAGSIVTAFARHTNSRIHIVILAQSQQAADELIARHTKSQYEFQAVDAMLMKNVRVACALLATRLPKINYFVLSQAVAVFDSPRTAEGLHRLLVLNVYGAPRSTSLPSSRMRPRRARTRGFLRCQRRRGQVR